MAFIPHRLLHLLLLSCFVVLATGFAATRFGPVPAVTLPLEVMGPDGFTTSVTVDVPNASGVRTLYLQVHNLSYDGKGSVRINNGPWISLTDDRVTCNQPERALECIGGAYATIRFTLPINGIVKGTNTIKFRHNYQPGNGSSGWRVLQFNLLRSDGSTVLPESAFAYDDPSQWQPPLPSFSDIQEGKMLWNKRNLLVDFPGGPPIKAACGDCHAQDGRDLKYFNYSNHSIIARSEFHGLTHQQAQQIASYIRSIELVREDGTSYEAPGTPWDPPYQPGPGLDAKPVDEWAAGAGLTAVLDEDIDMLPYLFPDGNGGVDISPIHADVDGTLNMREMPVALQFPDWNGWLPDVHPMDYWNGFTSGKAWKVYTNNLQDAIADGNAKGIERELNWMTSHAKAESSDRMSGDDVAFAEARLSMFQWQLVKTWETMHTNHLEDKARNQNGDYFDEPRSWMGRARTVFDLAPHISSVNGLSGTPYTYGSSLQDNFFSHAWYHLQVIINPGADPRSSSQVPVDWNYQDAFVRAFSDATDVGAGLRFVQSWIKKTQMLNRPDLAKPLHGPKGWGPNQIHPYWIMGMYNTTGKEGAAFQNLPMDLRRQLLDALLRSWVDHIQQFDLSAFPRGKKNDEWEPSNYLPSPDAPTRLHFANMLYRDLPRLDAIGVDPGLLHEIALWGESMWPRGDWEDLIEYDDVPNQPPSISITEPSDGATFTAPARITIRAKASDTDGTVAQVQFFANDILIQQDTSAPYRVIWDDVPEGTYTLKATATDDAGKTASATVQVTIEGEAEPPPTDLTAYWRLDESRGTIATDAQGNYPGTLKNGPAWKPNGRLNGALAFDGTNDMVHLGTPDVTGTAMTIALWMKADDFDQVEGRLISKASGTNEGKHFWMVSTVNRTALRFRLKTNGRTTTLKSGNNVIKAGTWHHVAAVYDGSRMRIYLDGIEIAAQNKTGAISTNASVPAALGNQPQGGRGFDGLLDDIRLYHRALSAEEIGALAEGNAPPPISQNQPPIAAFSVSAEVGATSQPLSFDGSDSYDPDGEIVAYVWDFGDGKQGTGATVQHSYSAAGTYLAKLTVTDNEGTTATASPVTIKIEAAQAPPSVTLTNPEDEVVLMKGTNLTLKAAASDADGTIQKVEFLVDGTVVGTDNRAPFQCQWQGTTPGVYEIKARARDNDGIWGASESISVHVSEAPQRVVDGLLVLYDFSEAQGTSVHDVSGVGAPLDLTIQNPSAVNWTTEALVVHNPTLIKSVGRATKVTNAIVASNELTLEAWVQTSSLNQDGPARIVTLSGNSEQRNVTLGQGEWGNRAKDTYDVRLRSTATNSNGTPSLTTSRGVMKKQLQHVVYVRDAGGTARLYVDGVMKQQRSVGGTLANWDTKFHLALGNELTEDRPWKGTYHLVALYSRALNAEEVRQNYDLGADPPGQHAKAAFASASETVVGDLEGNGSIDASDAMLLLEQVVHADAAEAGDVTGDGTTTAYDAWLIHQAAADMLPCFAVDATCKAPSPPRASGTLQWGAPRFEENQVYLPLELTEAEGALHSLQLDVPLTTSGLAVTDVTFLGPEGWQTIHYSSESAFRLAMMGATPLESGRIALLTLQLPDPATGINLTGQGFLLENETQSLQPVDLSVPATVELFSNYPNPFNPSTQISYQLAAKASVTLEIYNVLGQRILTLVDATQQAGRYTVTWDGRTSAGHQAPSGTYLYRLRAQDQLLTRTMMLMK